jgi:hypothetical protein
MLHRLRNVGWDPQTSNLNSNQIARQSTWGIVPDQEMTVASMHTVECVPTNKSTITRVNPLDPASTGYNWHRIPSNNDAVIPAGNSRRFS